MTSYSTVQIVAHSATPISQDYVVLAPGYTFSDGSVAPAGGGPGSSGTSMTGTSALSLQAGSSNVTIDLSATGVAAGSYVTVSVDNRGRVTGGSTSVATNFVTGTWTSGVSAGNVQGLGSTWTVSRLSSALSILGNEVWASGFSGPHLSTITVREGGTGITTLAVGDVLFGWSASSFSRLPVGAGSQVLTARSDGTVEWATPAGGPGGSGITFWQAMSLIALGF